jgi:hypothetical protein
MDLEATAISPKGKTATVFPSLKCLNHPLFRGPNTTVLGAVETEV